MHKSELKTHQTLINLIIKEYELRAGTTRAYRYCLLQNQILKLTQHSTTNSQLHSIPYVYYSETLSARVCELLSTACRLPMNWCL